MAPRLRPRPRVVAPRRPAPAGRVAQALPAAPSGPRSRPPWHAHRAPGHEHSHRGRYHRLRAARLPLQRDRQPTPTTVPRTAGTAPPSATAPRRKPPSPTSWRCSRTTSATTPTGCAKGAPHEHHHRTWRPRMPRSAGSPLIRVCRTARKARATAPPRRYRNLLLQLLERGHRGTALIDMLDAENDAALQRSEP